MWKIRQAIYGNSKAERASWYLLIPGEIIITVMSIGLAVYQEVVKGI